MINDTLHTAMVKKAIRQVIPCTWTVDYQIEANLR